MPAHPFMNLQSVDIDLFQMTGIVVFLTGDKIEIKGHDECWKYMKMTFEYYEKSRTRY